ncbi:COX15/CtaA family protein [Prosthecodimorpha staleyi]|uniref:Heme A synthase n=1 Tax=Prosthecodimorpha staleyi TaxID=2840188 RepID=A0A947GB69_9HYPH|nr:COX15/CtaA family protein [Prosthecodimorpha staleyi]MBT9288362.1 COX15/CtaA family protein [Prosthecodimorpha staleyi]
MSATLSVTPSAVPASTGTGPVRIWLGFVAFLVFAMVIVGGATRLTDSGLSITEWQPLLGALPPLTDAAWHDAFEKYRQIPQYRLVNQGMSLEAFKVIFWWEWAHRFLGRFIGVAFLVPFLVFAATGRIARRQVPRFVTLFALGGLQGAVGWWMVASGLVDRVDVAPYRLATHLTFACFIFAALVWTALSLDERGAAGPVTAGARGRRRGLAVGATVVTVAVFVQIFLGGLVAGNDAGLVYNTWPSMNGSFLPDAPLALEPAWRNLFENHGLVQFVHRMGAYTLFALALVQAGLAVRAGGAARASGLLLGLAVAAQAVVGILTLLMVVPLGLALVHQGLAVLVLGIAVAHLKAVRRA